MTEPVFSTTILTRNASSDSFQKQPLLCNRPGPASLGSDLKPLRALGLAVREDIAGKVGGSSAWWLKAVREMRCM